MASDELDLRWDLVSTKLKKAGYATHWVGKGHTGYMSTAHLPTARGFDSFTGFLGGAQSYTDSDRWRDSGPFNDTTYSSDLYGQVALDIVDRHSNADGPLFLYLPWQAVHSPYNTVPGFDCEAEYGPYPGVCERPHSTLRLSFIHTHTHRHTRTHTLSRTDCNGRRGNAERIGCLRGQDHRNAEREGLLVQHFRYKTPTQLHDDSALELIASPFSLGCHAQWCSARTTEVWPCTG